MMYVHKRQLITIGGEVDMANTATKCGPICSQIDKFQCFNNTAYIKPKHIRILIPNLLPINNVLFPVV